MEKKSFYYADANQRYEGYSDAATWNGWTRPLFTKETATKIMDELDSETKGYYDSDKDAFVVETKFGAKTLTETYTGKDYETADGVLHLYAIGSGAWTWDA